jgi:hypothetical protein
MLAPASSRVFPHMSRRTANRRGDDLEEERLETWKNRDGFGAIHPAAVPVVFRKNYALRRNQLITVPVPKTPPSPVAPYHGMLDMVSSGGDEAIRPGEGMENISFHAPPATGGGRRAKARVTRVIIRHVTAEITALAVSIPAGFLKDPADRIIAATAMIESMPLVTADAEIRAAKIVETLW